MISQGSAFSRIAQAERHWRDCVQQVRGGDAQGLARLYDETSGVIYGLALRMLGDPDRAEAVTVEVYQQVWRSAKQKDPEGGILDWLVSLTRQRVREKKAKTKAVSSASSVVESKEGFHPSADRGHGEGGPSQAVFLEEAALIRQALDGLPHNQREWLELAFFQGLATAEIAAIRRASPDVIKAGVREGMVRLRAAVASLAIRSEAVPTAVPNTMSTKGPR